MVCYTDGLCGWLLSLVTIDVLLVTESGVPSCELDRVRFTSLSRLVVHGVVCERHYAHYVV